MKILVLSNLYPPHYVGGYELHCRTMVEGLRSRGHEVFVLTSDHGLGSSSFSSSNPKTASHFSKDHAGETEENIFRSLKIHGMFGHPFLGILQLQSLESHNNRTLVTTLQEVKPDLVYVWSCSGLSRSMLFTLQKTGLPTVFAFCDYWLPDSEKSDVWISWWNKPDAKKRHRFLRALWTHTGRRRIWQEIAPTNPMHHLHLQRLHFCSRALRDGTVARGLNAKHGAVIHCSADLKKFNGRPRIASQPLQRLLFAGRLNADKGVMTALRALALIRDKFAGQLNIYGRGEPEYEQRLISFSKNEKLPVIFHDLLSPEQMPEVYRAHDALLFTSEWEEPFALTPLEAMACGLPVIATITGGSAELFRHRENALTYPAGNAEELALRILELDADGALREKIARAGFAEVHARLGEETICNQVEAYLLETLRTWRPVPLPAYDAAVEILEQRSPSPRPFPPREGEPANARSNSHARWSPPPT